MPRNPGDYLRATTFVESDAPLIRDLAQEIVGGVSDELERACRLFYAVRDGIRYDAYHLELAPQAMRATYVIERGQSWCVPKSVLLAALCRAVGIPCGLCYANVCNHMATRKLLDFLGTNVFYYHGYNELYLRGRWVKATVSFNRTLCERARLAPLDFDGVHDSIYHPYDLAGHRYMEYLVDHGCYVDVPYDDIVRTFAQHYPTVERTGGHLAGDFAAELGAEAAAK
jgi:transglutaminase-like putative cysteine protease